MRAFALKDWWCGQGGDCMVAHPLENTFWGYKAGCQLYNVIQKKMPWFHFAYFHFLESASIHRFPNMILGAKKFLREVSSFSPDLIVSTHAHLNHGYFELSKVSSKLRPRFAVYCGELADGRGFSRHWVNPNNDLFVSPYKEGAFAAQKRGMPVDKILIGGPLLRKDFYLGNQKFNRVEILNKYRLEPNLPIYLLGTGANGVNHHLSIIRAINKANLDCQILALCGRNHKTYEEIRKFAPVSHCRVVPFPHLEASTMVDLLKVSTWMLARPGAGLTTEAIVTGCPMIFDLSGGCMPQETNNLNFWKCRATELLCSSSPAQLVHYIKTGKEVPRLNIPLGEHPDLLLNALRELGEGKRTS